MKHNRLISPVNQLDHKIRLAGIAAIASLVSAQPLTLNVVDVAGNLALTQDALENFAAKNPNLVSRITLTKAPSPELP